MITQRFRPQAGQKFKVIEAMLSMLHLFNSSVSGITISIIYTKKRTLQQELNCHELLMVTLNPFTLNSSQF